MRIKVVSRRYFEEKKGTAELGEILASSRVVSIQSTYGMDSEPPFEQEMLSHPNLLAMVFDDEWDRSCEGCDYIRLFRREDAERIVQFVGFGRMPLIVQCTAAFRDPARSVSRWIGTSTNTRTRIRRIMTSSRKAIRRSSRIRWSWT